MKQQIDCPHCGATINFNFDTKSPATYIELSTGSNIIKCPFCYRKIKIEDKDNVNAAS